MEISSPRGRIGNDISDPTYIALPRLAFHGFKILWDVPLTREKVFGRQKKKLNQEPFNGTRKNYRQTSYRTHVELRKLVR